MVTHTYVQVWCVCVRVFPHTYLVVGEERGPLRNEHPIPMVFGHTEVRQSKG